VVEFQRQLHAAIVAAFSEAELKQLLSDTFGVRLESVAQSGTMPEMALEVVQWSVRNNAMARLVQAIVKARPNNAEVSQFFERYVRLSLAPAQQWVGAGIGDMGQGDINDTVAMLVRAIQGDKPNNVPGLIDRLEKLSAKLDGYIDSNEQRTGENERRITMLEDAMTRRIWPWVIAGGGIVTGAIGIGMAVVERFF